MSFDFALVLVLLTFISGIIWLGDRLFFAPARQKADHPETSADPVIVEYARSFFPIFLLVLILRSFIVEPFKIPSGSMMPTLLIGDFILVNKYDYGIRLPVLNTKIIENGTPRRGDIVVFRYPDDPRIPFIKRIVGLPGDHIAYYDKTLYINGKPMLQESLGRYRVNSADKRMDGALHKMENLDGFNHEILLMNDRYSHDIEATVPDGHYFVLGDNRDNSKDSRFWGFLPDDNLMGRAFMVWMNWRYKEIWNIPSWEAEWNRIGTKMQ